MLVLFRHGNCPENANFRREKKNCLRGKESGGTKKKGSTGFSSAPNTRKTYGARSHVDDDDELMLNVLRRQLTY